MSSNIESQDHIKGWKIFKIEEIGEVVSGGTPSTKIEEYYGGNISWITPKDLSGYEKRYIYKGERNITEEGLNNSSAKLLPKGTVLFSSRAPIGYVAIAGQELATNQGFKNIICNPDIVNNHFMYYKMKTLKEHFESIAGGSTFKEVSGKIVKEQKILLPPLHEQEKIVNILNALDDKIELNNEMNKTLEEMAQAIFKRWFVDFEFPNEDGEPYKSSGGKFVESELGMIPEGWKTATLGDLIEISSGKRPSKKLKDKTQEFCIPLIGASGVMGYVKDTLYNEKILIIGRVGTLGVVQRHKKECWPSDNTLVIKTIYYEYIYQILKTIDYDKFNRGSTQPLITQTDIKNVKIIVPSKEVLEKYERVVGALLNKTEENLEENIYLSTLRDTLLPKLMSGEIRVPDAEREVEACLQKSN